jgi:hypothetical protein
MTNEQILSWMIVLGTDWVDWEDWVKWESGLNKADTYQALRTAINRSLIEVDRGTEGRIRYRLTPKAIAQLEGETDDQRADN